MNSVAGSRITATVTGGQQRQKNSRRGQILSLSQPHLARSCDLEASLQLTGPSRRVADCYGSFRVLACERASSL